MTSRVNNAFATLRLIAVLGRAPAIIFNDLVACLKDITAFETANIILLDGAYGGRDFLSDFELPAAVSERYATRWFNREEALYYPSHIRLQNDPTLGIMRVSDFSPDFGESELYKEIMGHSEHHWIAGISCRSGPRPIGNFGIGRPASLPNFSDVELGLLARARPYVSQALAAPAAGAATERGEDLVETAMVCADPSGEVFAESANGWRMLRWVCDTPLSVTTIQEARDAWSRPLLAEMARRVRAALSGAPAPPAILRRANAYGDFVLRAHALGPPGGGGFSVGVQIERHLPLDQRLYRSPDFRALSSREKMVAQALVRGETNTEIAGRLGLAPSTVITHVRNIYARLEVNSRANLAGRLLGLDPGPDV